MLIHFPSSSKAIATHGCAQRRARLPSLQLPGLSHYLRDSLGSAGEPGWAHDALCTCPPQCAAPSPSCGVYPSNTVQLPEQQTRSAPGCCVLSWEISEGWRWTYHLHKPLNGSLKIVLRKSAEWLHSVSKCFKGSCIWEQPMAVWDSTCIFR